MNALDHVDLDELIAHLQDANYIGAFKAAKVISELADENSRLRQRVLDLQDLTKKIVWYQDITMKGWHSKEYEDGFWDAVAFVEKHQRGEK
jgi:hypothetical protein